MKKKANILITGPINPPAGGISIHINRLKNLIQNDFNLDFIDESSIVKKDYFNVRSLDVFTYIKKVIKADLIYIHSGSHLLKKIHIIIGKLFRKKIIITIHGYKEKKRRPLRKWDRLFYEWADQVILVNEDLVEKINIDKDKCIIQHAFIPPVLLEEEKLPLYITDKITDARNNQKVIICANASRLDHYDHQDLYGLDLSIEVAKRLHQKNIPFYFVFNVSSLENGKVQYSLSQREIKESNLTNQFWLTNEKISFVKLIEQSDIVLRPTNTDGDALTVREALFMGKETLASDIIKRPNGTTVFKTRDLDDLEEKLTHLIHQVKKGKRKSHEMENEYTYQQFYCNLIKSHTTLVNEQTVLSRA